MLTRIRHAPGGPPRRRKLQLHVPVALAALIGLAWIGQAAATEAEMHPGPDALQSAAENGNPDAQFHLGMRYYDPGCRLPARNAEALRWLLNAAAQHQSQAEAWLGHIYLTGHCETQDDAEGARWLQRAADDGNRAARVQLAGLYDTGTGVAADPAESAKLRALAATCRRPLKCFAGEPTDAAAKADAAPPEFTDNSDLRAQAESGDAGAQFRLGERHYSELHRDPRRDAEALKWFRLAAAQGYARAEWRLGYVYFTGRGLPQDYTEAAQWFRRAAEHGDPDAARKLANMYLEGKGVPVDRAESRHWSEILAKPQRDRERRWIAGTAAITLLFACALFALQRDKIRGWPRWIVEPLVHVAGIALVANSLITYGAPELLFPKCSYGFLAASCPDYHDLTMREAATWLRNWQMMNLLMRFMAGVGLVFDGLAVWYLVYLWSRWRADRRSAGT